MISFKTEPHGQHEVVLLEDAEKAGERIYEINDSYCEGRGIRILGSEIASLCEWWSKERQRPGESSEEE